MNKALGVRISFVPIWGLETQNDSSVCFLGYGCAWLFVSVCLPRHGIAACQTGVPIRYRLQYQVQSNCFILCSFFSAGQFYHLWALSCATN